MGLTKSLITGFLKAFYENQCKNKVKNDSEKTEAPPKEIPSSVAQRTRSKKRKLSQISTSSAAPKNINSINLSSQPQAAENDTEDRSNNGPASVEPADDVILPTQRNSNGSGNPLNNGHGHVEPSIDDSILNSEIYQIYCQEEDPGLAGKKLRNTTIAFYLNVNCNHLYQRKDLKA